MIGKLKKQNTWGECLEKLNELVDAVNEIKQYLDWDEISGKPSEEELCEMVKDPKYWKEQDPITVHKVEQAFQKKYSENTAENCKCAKNAHKSDLEEALEGFPGLFKSNKDEPLVDALMRDVKRIKQKVNFEQPEAKENVDPYAEQRKWIGCVCRFWYDNPDNTVLDYLGKIQTGENGIEYYGKETYDWFPHCEPILPTDNAIYKGSDNE